MSREAELKKLGLGSNVLGDIQALEKEILKAGDDMTPSELEKYRNSLRAKADAIYGQAIEYLGKDTRFRFLFEAALKYPKYLTFDDRISTAACDGEKMMYSVPHVLSLLNDPGSYRKSSLFEYKPGETHDKDDTDEDKERKRLLKPMAHRFTKESIAAVAFLISHEIMHAELGHFFRSESYVDPNDAVGQKRNNFALDHEINTMLTVLGLPLPDCYVLYIGKDKPYEGTAKLSGDELFKMPEARVAYEALRSVPDKYFEDDKHGEGRKDKSKLSQHDKNIDQQNQKKDKQKQEQQGQGQQDQQQNQQQNQQQKQQKDQQGQVKPNQQNQKQDQKPKKGEGGGESKQEKQDSKGTTPIAPLDDIGTGFSGDPIVDRALDKMAERRKQLENNVESKMQADQQYRDAMQKITKALRDAGTDISRELAMLFGAKLIQATRATSTWKRLLRSFLAATNKREVSWSRLDRRFIAYRMYFPKIKDEQLSLSIGFDTSGSMNVADMQAFMVEIEKIMRLFSNQYMIVVHLFHDAVYKSMVFNDKIRYSATAFAAWIEANRSTEGGTDFTEVVGAITNDSKSSKYKTLGGVIFTDGIGGYSDAPPKAKIIWCLVGDDPGQLPGIHWGLRVRFDPPKET